MVRRGPLGPHLIHLHIHPGEVSPATNTSSSITNRPTRQTNNPPQKHKHIHIPPPTTPHTPPPTTPPKTPTINKQTPQQTTPYPHSPKHFPQNNNPTPKQNPPHKTCLTDNSPNGASPRPSGPAGCTPTEDKNLVLGPPTQNSTNTHPHHYTPNNQSPPTPQIHPPSITFTP